MRYQLPLFLYIVAALAVAGCGPKRVSVPVNDEPELPSTPPPSIRVEDGKPSPQLAGTFTSKDGASTVILGEDGTYKSTSKRSVRLKDGTTKPVGGTISGKWSVKGRQFIVRQASGYTGVYDWSLDGDRLTLTPQGRNNPITYIRKSP